MNPDDISSGLAISDKMKEAYCELNIDTPFSIFAQAALWDAINKQKKEE